jgi:DNA polymerase IIIc chi subunit
MSLLDTLKQNTNKSAHTENDALTNLSTLDPVLDFFSRAGAMRGREKEAVDLFKKAYSTDKNLALKALFYLRDIRGGQGERSVFKETFFDLANRDGKVAIRLMPLIPEYGRWDEILDTTNPITYDTAVALIATQFEADEKDMADKKTVSLMAKWLPSENASSEKSRKQAVALAKNLGLKPSQYRRKVVALRKYIKLLEQQMSAKAWDNIQYDKLPSQAYRKHIKAFKRHDESRYEKYLESVVKGEKKINTATLFAYEVYELIDGDWDGANEATANAMWANLPDYTNGTNALVVADVSGSMSGRPMAISVSLALYFAERNTGPFKDCFLTFSAKPHLQHVRGKTLTERMDSIETADWDMNTDVIAAFRAILKAAVDSKASADEMPRVLYIISDMEFDAATSSNDETNFEVAKREFSEAGYELPHVVFWNVDSRNDQSPATMFDKNVTLISGASQSTFQYAVAGKTPLESMNEILGSERYAPIEV